MKIGAQPSVVFPLLCPEKEKEWINGWTYEMIYSQSGSAELGCTFKTDLQPEGESYWIMTRHVTPYEGQYVRFVVGKMFVTLFFKLTERDGDTDMDVVFTCTGVTEKGNEFIVEQGTAHLDLVMKRMEHSLNYFINNGKMLDKPV